MKSIANNTTKILLPGIVITYINDTSEGGKTKSTGAEQSLTATKATQSAELLKTG